MWLTEYRTEAHRLAELLYWDCLETPEIVLQKDNSLLAVIHFRGHDLSVAAPAAQVAYATQLNNLLRRFPEGWGLFSEAQRRSVAEYPVTTFPDPVSTAIEAERRQYFCTPGRHFTTETYLTLVYAKPRPRTSRWRSWLYTNLPPGSPDAATVAYFTEEVHRVLHLLQDCCPSAALLTATETTPGVSPLLTYLHSTVSPKAHAVGLPEEVAYLDTYLTDVDIYPGLYPSWGDPATAASFHGYLATVGIRRYPEATYPALLHRLSVLPLAYRFVVRSLPLDAAHAAQEIYKYRRRWLGASKRTSALLAERLHTQASSLVEYGALDYTQDAADAQVQVEHGQVSFGYTTATVVLWDRDLETLGRQVATVEAALNSAGCIAKVEDLNTFAAWRGTIPGDVYSNIRRPLLHSQNLAHLLPTTSRWSGPAHNTHLDGPPLLRTTGAGQTPFNLDTYDGDVGMAYIAGPIGAGKSVLLATMVVSWLKYPGAEVRIFDAGQSLRCMTHAVGGQWYDLAAQVSLDAHTGRHLDDKTAPWETLWTPPQHRWQCFEMGDLLKTPARLSTIIRPLLHRLKERMTGAPTLFVFDEGHLYLSHEVFAQGIDDYIRGLRKLNGAVIFATQSVADASRSALAPIISDSSMTRIYLANYHALEPDTAAIYEGWGLSPTECTLLAGMTPKRDYYYQGREGHGLFQLALGPMALAFAGVSRPHDLRRMADMYHGDAVAFAVDWLHDRGLHREADALTSKENR